MPKPTHKACSAGLRFTPLAGLLAASVLTLFTSQPAMAITTAIVGPDIDAGDQSAEYRASYETGDSSDSLFAHRLHYQYALNGAVRARIVGNQQRRRGDNWDYRATTVELQWQYRESEDGGWDGAFRLENQFGDGKPDLFRLAWAVRKEVGRHWQLTGNLLVGKEYGAGAADGLRLGTRSQVTYRLKSGARIGLEMFNDYNTTADVGSIDEQEHVVGPLFRTRIARHWSIFAGYLTGLTNRSVDHDFRFRIRRDF